MTDQHTREGQLQRAKRLREQIESLKSGNPISSPAHPKSLREQVEERAHEARLEESADNEESLES